MPHSSQTLILIAFLSICSLYNLANCDILDNIYPYFRCDQITNASKTYINNANLLFSDFISNSSQKLYYNTSTGNSPDKVFGYYMCRGDLNPQACRSCLVNATQFARILDCKYQDFFFIPNADCIFGYSNHSMYGEWDHDMSVTSPLGVNKYDYEQYKQTVLSNMQSVINEAASEKVNDTKLSVLGFATKVVNLTGDEKMYTLAQCTPDLLGGNCSDCLTRLLSGVDESFYEYQGVDALEPKCLFRFYYRSLIDPGVAKPSKNEGANLSNHLGIYSALILFIYYTFFG